MMNVLPSGVHWIPGYLDQGEQQKLLQIVRQVVAEAPLYTPAMPRTGKPMNVRMTNCGSLGWVTDRVGGYRYQPHHPVTGKLWPEMPERLRQIWSDLASFDREAEACLINYYDEKSKMGLHQDRDEHDLAAPVVSISLGDSCLFRIGGTRRNERTTSLRLASGDALILSGPGRLCFHGVDRIYPDTSTLLRNGGRINLTLRRVSLAGD